MECEVELIKSELLRDFAKFCLEGLPEYFFKVPASSSGKYHPNYTLGEGGLVRHTKAAVKIANDLLNLEQYQHLDRDSIIFALIFHDGFKKGYIERSETVSKHPLLAAEYVGDMYIEYGERILKGKVKDIMRLISSHMGQWNAGILPKPVEEDEKFVHLCDYLANRKYIICELEG